MTRLRRVSATSRVKTKERRKHLSATLAPPPTRREVHRSDAYRAMLRSLEWRSRFITAFFIVAAGLLAYRAAFVVLSPSYRARAALVEANLQPVFVSPLLEQVDQLRMLGANMETTPLVNIREALQRTVRLAESAAKEFEAQYASWAVVRGQIKNDGSTYDELRRQLDETQRLQAAEIIRLHEALDKAAKPSVWWDIGTQGLSFLLGIMSSIFAIMTWERLPALKAWWRRQVEGKRFPEPPTQ